MLAAPAVADAVVAGPVIVLQGVSAGWWETLHGILRARFSSLVEGPEGVLVAYDDEAAADLEAATEWIRVAVVTNDGGQVELGVARHRRRGELVATIAVPAGQGDARAWELADAINAAFRGQQDQDVAFRPAPYPIARGLDGDRHELEVRVPFEREEVHAS
ncbi:MAG TPA: phage tail terminator-like protein [Planctomycetota bacterium]|nr:phage tail terminator-like protein [Planctomycetota bacterium]